MAYHESVLPRADPNNALELNEILRNLRCVGHRVVSKEPIL